MSLSQNHNFDEINALLRKALHESLRDKFEKRLHELGTNTASALKMMKMERKSLLSILDATAKRTNVENLRKLAGFLKMDDAELIKIHLDELENASPKTKTDQNKKAFIREHFDLAVLKKAGFIQDANNMDAIENRINSYLGLNSIFDYSKRSFDAAFMAGTVKPANTTTRDFWLTSAKEITTKIDNPYYYDRQALMKYFPLIRWNSTQVEYGLINVIKALYKLGITVIFQPSLSTLHLRGATFAVNDQPCIALTDYKGFYPTLWYCLVHELYHVLFDWEEIRADGYHTSDDPIASLTLNEREVGADEFAREYLFSSTKLEIVKPYLRDDEYVDEVARENNIHPSLIYVYYAFEYGSIDRMAWARARKKMPPIKQAVFRLDPEWEKVVSIDETVKRLKLEIYN